MPESIKTPAKTKFPKCEPCQSRLAFIEAYRAIRALLHRAESTSPQFKAIKESLRYMAEMMPYKKAQYFYAALESKLSLDCGTFENKRLFIRKSLRSCGACGMKGMMPETALAQRDDEAFL